MAEDAVTVTIIEDKPGSLSYTVVWNRDFVARRTRWPKDRERLAKWLARMNHRLRHEQAAE